MDDYLFDDYLYARISEDEVGLEKGVTRQLNELRPYSEARGGRIVGEWSDNDISASKLAPRPDFERLMQAVSLPNTTGRQRRIVTVHTSRLWRNRQERAKGIDTLGSLGLIVLPKNGPELDLRTAAGRMVAGMLGEVDTGESETKAERIRSSVVERANQGRANGDVLYGWTRMYQYDNKGRVIGFDDVENTVEADVVRDIIDRLLAGESLISITNDLNDRGIPAPGAGHDRKKRAKGQDETGSRWHKTSVKKIAVRPANIALRVYHRGRPDEELITAAWPKIVELDKYDRVMALLSDPSRNTEKPGSRQHLLTWGIGECGAEGCGAHLRVAMRGSSRYGVKKPTYVCDSKGCVGRNQEYVDEVVTEFMVALMQRPDVTDLLTGDSGKAAEMLARVNALRARMQRAATDYAEERIEADQLNIITRKLKPELEKAEAQARAFRTSPHLGLVMSTIGEQAEQRWASLSVTQRRAVMQTFGVRVVILPTRRGPGFDPESVRVIPRQRESG